jgi:hypothetical protein
LAAGITLPRVSQPVTVYPHKRYSLPRNHLLDTEKGVFKYQASNIASVLVLDSKSDADSTSQALAVDHNLCLLEIVSTSDVVKSSLRINCDALFVWVTSRQAISSILEHQNVAIHVICQNLSDRKPMTDVSSIAMEHEESDILCLASVSWLDEKCAQVLTIRCRKGELFGVQS